MWEERNKLCNYSGSIDFNINFIITRPWLTVMLWQQMSVQDSKLPIYWATLDTGNILCHMVSMSNTTETWQKMDNFDSILSLQQSHTGLLELLCLHMSNLSFNKFTHPWSKHMSYWDEPISINAMERVLFLPSEYNSLK